jgi:two-component system chemotaxis response regulator CheB
MENETPKFVVVIGTSAGGFFALAELISQLRDDIDAAFFVVMHLSNNGMQSFLLNQMQNYTTLPCEQIAGDTEIERGTIYFPPSNKHLIIKDRKAICGNGPRDNRWRPSIDVLFRSAAAAFDGHTIGIILTGMLDDGTSGMAAIKRCGGTAVVQDPNEAEYPDMPLSVMKEIEVDYCVPLTQIGSVISDIINSKEVVNTIIPTDIIKEVQIAETGAASIELLEEIGKPTVFCCPDCGGVLFEMKNGEPTRFKCHTGHSYTLNNLLLKKNKNLEASLWVALRILEERKRLLKRLVDKNQERGFKHSASDYSEKIEQLNDYVESLKKVLYSTQDEEED